MADSTTGLEDNVAGLLCYLFGWLSGLIFFLIEKDSAYVKFHALQSLIFFGGLSVLSIIAPFVPLIGGLLGLALAVAGFVAWVLMMIKAYQGEKFKLPVAGDIAEEQAG
ncbi:MAG: DUF4870 domain-containing protein [Pseudomonadales bacterium]